MKAQKIFAIINRINFLRTIILAFYSKRFYKEVAYQWKGFSFFHLFFLSALLALLPTYNVYKATPVNKFLSSSEAPFLINQLPNLYINQDRISIKESQPYFIYNKDKKPVAVINTAVKNPSLDEISGTLKVFITSDTVFIRDKNQITDLPIKFTTNLFNLNLINKYNLTSILRDDQLIVMAVPYLLYLFTIFIATLFLILLAASIGSSSKKFGALNLDFKSRTRLISIAAIPALIVGIIIQCGLIFNIFISIPIASLIYVSYAKLILRALSENTMAKLNPSEIL